MIGFPPSTLLEVARIEGQYGMLVERHARRPNLKLDIEYAVRANAISHFGWHGPAVTIVRRTFGDWVQYLAT